MSAPASDHTLPAPLVVKAVEAALAEDLGLLGDVTTAATVAQGVRASASFATRRPGVIAGLSVAREAFRQIDADVRFEPLVADGDLVPTGAIVARVSGRARSLLTSERVALNFLCHMSGIATETRRFVELIKGTRADIIDTRKTTPGLRAFEKYAVRCGGGRNHRAGLFDAILIKDNHIVAAGGIEAAIERARKRAGHTQKIEVEVGTLDELREALAAKPDIIMLDNMSVPMLVEAVAIVAGRAITEASGGVRLETVRAIAETGVDLISVGAITHSAPILDLGLDFDPEP